MPIEAGHSSEIAASAYTANSLPADENTPLVREANSTSRLHRICEHFLLGFFFTVFVSWGGFDYIISQFVPYEIFERKLDEHLAARKPL